MRQHLRAFGSTGAQIERPAGALYFRSPRRAAAAQSRLHADSPAGWRLPALSHCDETPLLHCGGSDGPTSFRPILFGSKRESAWLSGFASRLLDGARGSCCRVLNGPGGRSLAGARRPSILALFACLPAGGAKVERPAGAPSCRAPRRDTAARSRAYGSSPADWRIPVLSAFGKIPLPARSRPRFTSSRLFWLKKEIRIQFSICQQHCSRSQCSPGGHEARGQCALHPAKDQVRSRWHSGMANNGGVPGGLGALPVWRFAVVRWPWIVRTIEDRS